MLRKKLEYKSGTKMADSGFLIIYENRRIPDPRFGYGLPSLVILLIKLKKTHILIFKLKGRVKLDLNKHQKQETPTFCY